MIARLVLHQKVRGKRDIPEHFYLEFCDQGAKCYIRIKELWG